jgi:hypothetical protein
MGQPMSLRVAITAGLMALVSGCTPLGLNTASTNIRREEPARPQVLAAFGDDPAILTAAEWTDRRAPLLRKAFEDVVYGPVPVSLKGYEIARRVVDPAFAEGAGVLEEVTIRVGEAPDGPVFHVAIAYPTSAAPGSPVPLLINENFGGNAGAMENETLAGMHMDPGWAMGGAIRLVFGQYIMTGPNRQILERGYAYATFNPSDLADDSAVKGRADLARFDALLPPERRPTSVLGVWAAAFGWTLDVLEADPRIDASRTSAWGHSRHGKAALLAAAFDPRLEGVIPLQAGKGGATLTRSYAGESVKQITRSYPQWFTPAYATYSDNEDAAPIDQHQLIALVAPRPVLLGNGWKDVWSDPNGSFRAAIGADPVYRLFGETGLTQADMRAPPNGGRLEWFIRPGGHGVRAADWNQMLDWLDREVTGGRAVSRERLEAGAPAPQESGD